MARVVGKAEALAALEVHRRSLGDGCVMCAVVTQADRMVLVAETESAIVVLDRFASRPGHLLVIPRAHVERLVALDWPAYAEIQRLGYEACHALESVFGPKRVYVASLGTASPLAGSYPHVHLHVVPIHEDDERARPANVFSWSAGIVLYDDDEAAELTDTIRRAWPALTSR
jgi:diadenosine tetraphosphate (Ap4A) HIT family hydrolase